MLRRKSLGLKFRRQHPFGPYVLDFYCAELDLGIELDGTVHDTEDAKMCDAFRERALLEQGLLLLRFRNEGLEANPRLVLKEIEDVIDRLRRKGSSNG